MSKQSKHERIIREELDAARKELEEAEAVMRNQAGVVDVILKRVDTLQRILDRADADKGGDDAES